MITAWMLVVFAAIPTSETVVDRVAVAEVNHYYDGQGRPIFDQVIYYDWCPVTQRHQVRAWRLIKRDELIPRRDWQRGGFLSRFRDGDRIREVWAAERRETWTQYDPELAERDYLPREHRRGLTDGNLVSTEGDAR